MATEVNCLPEECPWFDKDDQVCAVLGIKAELSVIADTLVLLAKILTTAPEPPGDEE